MADDGRGPSCRKQTNAAALYQLDGFASDFGPSLRFLTLALRVHLPPPPSLHFNET